MKQKAIIFGAGATGSEVYEKVKNIYDVLCYIDNDDRKIGMKKNGINVNHPNFLHNNIFDKVIIATLTGSEEIFQQISGGGDISR